jgi:hypothetical protein
MRRIIVALAVVIGSVAATIDRADAKQLVSQTRAYTTATPVRIYPGRNTTIEFRTEEAITFVQLSDLSEIVFQTNAPLPSGQAKVIILRQIRPIQIEGATHSPIPNLTVSTVDRDGRLRTYTFNLLVRDSAVSVNDKTNNGVAIVPNQQAEAERLASWRNYNKHNTLETQMGTATLDDVERGLRVAIARGYTPSDDPVVYNVEQTLAIARNGTPLQQAMQQTQVGRDVMIELGEIGIESEIINQNPSQQQQQVEQEI